MSTSSSVGVECKKFMWMIKINTCYCCTRYRNLVASFVVTSSVATALDKANFIYMKPREIALDRE